MSNPSPASNQVSPDLAGKIAKFLIDIRTIIAFFVGIILAAFYLGGTVNDYSTRFANQENSTSELSKKYNKSQLDIDSISSKVLALEGLVAKLPASFPAGTAAQTLNGNAKTSNSSAINSDISVPIDISTATLSGLNGGVTYTDTLCPTGYYVAGIKSTGSTGATKYCIGCLISVQALCRRLPGVKIAEGNGG